MKWTPLAASIALAAMASADALVDSISPRDSAAGGCSSSYHGKFQVTIGTLGKRDIEKRSSCDNPDALLLTLHGGALKDAKNRTGYIASNYQFQFDEPPQVGSIYTSGFSACSNGSLALHGHTTFYQCLSGNFYNLYDRHWAEQCEPVEILIMPCGGGNAGGNVGKGGEVTVGTKVVQTTIITAIADGQPQVHTTTVAIPICQIGDGQIQGHTTPCGGGGSQASPVSQISDGQVHPPTKPPPIIATETGAPRHSGAPVTHASHTQTRAAVGTTGALRPSSSSNPQAPIKGDASKALPGVSVLLGIAIAGIMAL